MHPVKVLTQTVAENRESFAPKTLAVERKSNHPTASQSTEAPIFCNTVSKIVFTQVCIPEQLVLSE